MPHAAERGTTKEVCQGSNQSGGKCLHLIIIMRFLIAINIHQTILHSQIHQSGSSVAQQLSIVDPAWDAIAARAKHLDETFKMIFEQHTSKENQQVSGKARDPNGTPIRVMFCEEISDIASSQLSDLWRLGQAYFNGELRGINEPKPGNFKRIILTSIEQFCAYLRAAILSISGQRSYATVASNITWPATSNSANILFLSWLPQCLRYIRISYATLIRLDLPSEVLDIIQKLIDQIRLFCLSTIFKKTVERVKKLDEKETWKMDVPDFAGATQLPSHLEALVIEMLEEGQNACLKPEIRETALLEPQSEGQREICQRVKDLLNTFCEVIEKLAFQRCDDDQQAPLVSQLIGFPSNTTHQPIDDRDWGGNASWELRLLCCLANCVYCNNTFFNYLNSTFSKHGYPISTLVFEEGRSTINKLFNSILETYVEHKSDPLVGTIEPSMYIGRFQWDLVTGCGRLRPYAHECCDNLVRMRRINAVTNTIYILLLHIIFLHFSAHTLLSISGGRLFRNLHNITIVTATRARTNCSNGCRGARSPNVLCSEFQCQRCLTSECGHSSYSRCSTSL